MDRQSVHRPLPSRAVSSLKIKTRGASHEQIYDQFKRIWEEEKQRRKAKEASGATCEGDSCYGPEEYVDPERLWMKREGGKIRLAGQGEVSREVTDGYCESFVLEEQRLREDRCRYQDLYAMERPRWEKKWGEDQAEEERLREKARRENEENEAYYEETRTMLDFLEQVTLEGDDANGSDVEGVESSSQTSCEEGGVDNESVGWYDEARPSGGQGGNSDKPISVAEGSNSEGKSAPGSNA